ncbi:hypothetical protein [Psychromonas aquimarina]|uniref:hypothetical protein n=1 Tax=Psychromonas aquimarina TaxID=444919 RepID=UPI00048D456D|nr:hypothetical protein [Psychromonas aquimarina]
MIDIEKRKLLSEKLRHLISGQIDNLEYDDLEFEGHFDSDDRAVFEVFEQSWFLYDDFKSHKIELSKHDKRVICRWIIFLHSELEYEWPRVSLLSVRSLKVLFYRISSGVFFKSISTDDYLLGDKSIWPFYRKYDYDLALKNPKFLANIA